MSSHPNTYVAAVFTTIDGSDISTVLERLENNEVSFPNGDSYDIVGSDNESGVGVDENSFAIHSYATYGWGETCDLDKVMRLWADKLIEADYIVKCFPELKYSVVIGANWF